MDFMDKVERLREKADISYEEAKTVLTETDGDLLEAMILLEKQGRLDPPRAEEAPRLTEAPRRASFEKDKKDGHWGWNGFVAWIKSLIARGNRNTLQIRRKDNLIGAVPVTIFVLSAVIAFWVTALLLVIGLFCGCSYSFAGPDLGRDKINRAWDKAAEVAENIKTDFQREVDSAREMRNNK